MATGSEPWEGVPFRKRIDIQPDRKEEPEGSNISTFWEVSRRGLSVLSISADLKAVSLQHYEFPYCEDDVRWGSALSSIVSTEKLTAPDAIAVDNVSCSVIPNDLFPANGDVLADMLALEHGQHAGSSTIVASLDSWDAKCVALIPESVAVALPEGRLAPTLCCWVPALLRAPSAYHAHLHVSEKEFQLAVLQGKQLLLYNRFAHAAHSDILYFTMAALEQLTILHADVQLTLYGDVGAHDDLHSLLSRYVSAVRFADRPAGMTYAYAFNEFPAHQLPFLFNLPLCAL